MTLLIKIKTPVDYQKRTTSKYFVLGLFMILVSSSFFLLYASQNSVVDVATEVHSDVHTELQLLDPRNSLSASTE